LQIETQELVGAHICALLYKDVKNMESNEGKRYGVAITGGGTRLDAAATFLQALQEEDVNMVECISGVSGGAVAGILASIKKPNRIKGLLKRLETKHLVGEIGIPSKANVLTPKYILKIVIKMIETKGRLSMNELITFLGENLDAKQILESDLDFCMTIYNTKTKEPEYLWKDQLTEENLFQKLASSCCLPLWKAQPEKEGELEQLRLKLQQLTTSYSEKKKSAIGLMKFHKELVKLTEQVRAMFEGERDGGFGDGYGIAPLVERGYGKEKDKELLFIQLNGPATRSVVPKGVKVKAIKFPEPLGSLLDTREETRERNMRMGYYTGKKFLGKLRGNIYFFPEEEYEKLVREHQDNGVRVLEEAARDLRIRYNKNIHSIRIFRGSSKKI